MLTCTHVRYFGYGLFILGAQAYANAHNKLKSLKFFCCFSPQKNRQFYL